jgi:hypothetical protein
MIMKHIHAANSHEPASSSSPAYARARGANSAWIETYLGELEQHGQKCKAAKVAGVTIRAVQKRRNSDPAFASNESDAMAVAKDLVESEIFRRAIDGVQTVIISKEGKIITTKTEYSDQLLLRAAERLETGSWRQKQQIEHSAASPLQFATRAERKAAIERARAEMAAGQAKLREEHILPESM